MNPMMRKPLESKPFAALAPGSPKTVRHFWGGATFEYPISPVPEDLTQVALRLKGR